jgi:acetolactate synthase-1/2/3 large subunit
MTSVADRVVRALYDAGVRALFGVPGGAGNLDVIAAAGRLGLPFVLTSTETAAAIAALAQAEITGQPGVCLATIGPGAASIVNGIACASLDRAPLVAFTDTYPGGSSSPFEHQRLDHASLFACIAKASVRLDKRTAVLAVADALKLAVAGRPGPVHLDCPGGVLASDGGHSVTTAIGVRQLPATGSQDDDEALEKLLGRSRRPLLLVGLGARRAEDAGAIRGFCERRHVPALVTYKGKGVVPDAHPWFAGVFTNAVIERPVIEASDLLIGVGLDPVELLPRPWKYAQPIAYVGRWAVEDGHLPFATQVIADIPDAVQLLDAHLGVSDWPSALPRQLVADQLVRVAAPGTGFSPQRAVQIAADRLAAAAAHVTVDAGAHMLPATMLWPVREPNGLLISNGLSTMGFAVPAAVGAALLDRSRLVVALTGDGGALMCIGELLTAVRERLRMIVVVLNDASLSLIAVKQQARNLPESGVALGDVDWAALARSVGAAGFVVADEPSLDAALEQASRAAGPCVIDARVDGTNYRATLDAVRGGA